MADDIYIGGRQIRSKTEPPVWDTEIKPKTDEPTKDAKFSIDNPPADTEKATGGMVREHPLETFHKKSPGARQHFGKASQVVVSDN